MLLQSFSSTPIYVNFLGAERSCTVCMLNIEQEVNKLSIKNRGKQQGLGAEQGLQDTGCFLAGIGYNYYFVQKINTDFIHLIR